MKVFAVATTPDWSAPMESLWVSLETDQGRFRLDHNELNSELPSDIGRYRWKQYEAFADHLRDSALGHLDLRELRYSDDGDSFLVFADGSCLGAVHVAMDHAEMTEQVKVLRFYPPGSTDAVWASSVSGMKCVRI